MAMMDGGAGRRSAARALGAAVDDTSVRLGRPAAAIRSNLDRIDTTEDLDLLRTCLEVARRLSASDLELHFALRIWSAHPEEGRALADVSVAAKALGATPNPAFRLSIHHAEAEDWAEIAAADTFARWPSIQSICGPNRSVTLEDLQRSGQGEDLSTDTPLAWRIRDVRVTCRGRAVAVGARSQAAGAPSASDVSFIPASSCRDPSAALGWQSSPTPGNHVKGMALLWTMHRFSNYWHWLIEGLVKAVQLDDAGLLAHRPLIVAHTGDVPSFVLDSIAAAGIDPGTVSFAGSGFDVAVDDLVMPAVHRAAGGMEDPGGPASVVEAIHDMARFNPARGIELLRGRLGIDGRDRGSQRVFVSRADATTRRLKNEAALMKRLEPMGFRRVTLSGCSFSEQVDIFRDADVIVGPHGAGLSNVVFAPVGSTLVELHQADDWLPHFENLAVHTGVQHQAIVCRRDGRDPGDMVVDVDEVVDRVRHTIDGGRS